jgi:DNA-binding SARP family transcriptional activator
VGERALEIRLLGEIAVVRDGRAIALPASKKTRALLAYLVATRRVQLRETLCELLWNGPDDPRAALRWSLTKLRPLLDDRTTTRLAADRERVGFEAHGADIDLAAVRAAVAGGVDRATSDALIGAAARFRGELCEGLELSGCYRFHEWCTGEREAARALRLRIFDELVARLREAEPEEALRYARDRVTIDPLAEIGHVAVIELLGRLGRAREGLRQYETCRHLLEGELRARPSRELERARMALGQPAAPPASAPAAAPPPAAPQRQAAPLYGRRREQETLAELVAAGHGIVVLIGEPGIGKTRLLEELATRAGAVGARVFAGRAFDAERVRPYGAWIDALRPSGLDAALGRGDAADREDLFEAVARQLAAQAPALIVLDDLHWLDEASLALLHYVVRSPHATRLLVAGAARGGELIDNPPALRLIRTLRREGALREVELGPLAADDVAALARGVAGDVDGERVFAESAGNPLFALEVARALARGAAVAESLDVLIDERLGKLDDRARAVLSFAAALGRTFAPDVLAAVAGLAAADLVTAVDELERRGVLRASAIGYDFTHDLVRRGAYRQMSEPRRRLVHLQIARALAKLPDPDGALAGDVAHHAGLGGDDPLAATAALAAGRRCQRLFAFAEAEQLAQLGLRHAARLPTEERIRRSIALIALCAYRVDLGRARDLESQLSRLTVEACDAGMNAEVSVAYETLALLYWWTGDFAGAHASTAKSAAAGRASDPATAARVLAASARCLAHLEREPAHALALLAEARDLAERAAIELVDIPWALGLLRWSAGDWDAAVPLLERAHALATRAQDHWPAYDCLAYLTVIELERGRPAAALARCDALVELADKLTASQGEGSERPLARALAAIARLASDQPEAAARVDDALGALRAIDARAWLAYVLALLGERDAARGDGSAARRRAEEALDAAEQVGRDRLIARARALLARASDIPTPAPTPGTMRAAEPEA